MPHRLDNLKQSLARWTIAEYISALIRGLGGNHMAPGSANAMVTGENFTRAFRGVTALAGKIGSRLFFNCDQSYAGLGTATIAGTGSVFNVRQLLCYIGAGQVYFAGLLLAGVVASSTLSLVKKSGGIYAAGVATGPFQAGHAQPSAPTIYAKGVANAGFTTISGGIAVKIWRVSSITGQVSLASLPSNVLILNNQTAIVQFPLVDANGQDVWGIAVPKIGFDDLGVFYQLPISLQGEVAESVLAYTRATGAATIVDTTNIVDAAGANLTSADIGRRWTIGAYDSWIVSINSSTQAVMNDTNDLGADVTAPGTITHAVDGITRAIEIGYSNGALQGQGLAPDRAFPPPAGQFAGAINDVLWLESDGIIFVGDPGQIGSFPPKNALFPNEPAIQYLPGEEGLTLRFGKHSFGVLSYVGGTPALEYQEVWSNLGIAYPQNVALGARGRLMGWFGKPAIVEGGIEPDYQYATKVMPDFAGWDEGQTADAPIVLGYDARGEYEVWCWRQKVMAQYVPKSAWCAPIDLTGKVTGNIVAAITHQKQLYLACSDGADITIYEFDVGTGSVMVIHTSDERPNGYGATITEVLAQGRVDNTAHSVRIEIVKNFSGAPDVVRDSAPAATGTQDFYVAPPNILGAKQHKAIVTMTSVGGITVGGMPVECGLDFIETKGELHEVRTA